MNRFFPTSYPGILLREVEGSDSDTLYQIFAVSHGELLATLGNYGEVQRAALVRIQFQAQQEQYRRLYPDARFNVIVTNGKVIGNRYVASSIYELRLVDLNLLPQFRNQGIGRALVQDLLDEGEGENKRVTLHVKQGNPATRLYERLGFSVMDGQGIYLRMEWQPPRANATVK